jgi:hypothetical protein
MSYLTDGYCTTLINNILYAGSQVEVNRFIDAAYTALKQQHIKKELINRFIDDMSDRLNAFNVMEEDAQHWSNIRAARVFFYRIKNKSESTES